MNVFEISFTKEEIKDFLDRIEVKKSEPSEEFLKMIVSGILEHIPFQNITMLTNERTRPSKEMIKSDMLSGMGGLCTVRNPFLHEFLRALGFNVRFISSTMGKPDCHISLIANINGIDWWVDVGNGFPYLEPIMIGDTSVKSNWFMEYKLVFDNNKYHVYHKSNESTWYSNHNFTLEEVEYSVFDKMHELHYSQPGWGPFLTGLRVNRFWKDGGVIIRDERASTRHEEETLDSIKKLDNFLNKWFPKKGFTGFINIEKADKIWRTAQKG